MREPLGGSRIGMVDVDEEVRKTWLVSKAVRMDEWAMLRFVFDSCLGAAK